MIIPEGWPPKWHAWYRPLRRHLCWALKHHAEFSDVSWSYCRWCGKTLCAPDDGSRWKGWAAESWRRQYEPTAPPPSWDSTGRPGKLSGPQGHLP